jgi:hypothetical protein
MIDGEPSGPGFATVAVISDVVVALSAFAAAFIAYRGLTVWKEELHGRAGFGVARRVLRDAYRLRTVIRAFRFIGSTGDYQEKFKSVSAVAGHLDASLLEASVLWESRLEPAKRELKSCLDDLQLAIHEDALACNHPAAQFGNPDADKQRQDVLWCFDPRHDRFGERLNRAVAGFESELRPMLAQRRR